MVLAKGMVYLKIAASAVFAAAAVALTASSADAISVWVKLEGKYRFVDSFRFSEAELRAQLISAKAVAKRNDQELDDAQTSVLTLGYAVTLMQWRMPADVSPDQMTPAEPEPKRARIDGSQLVEAEAESVPSVVSSQPNIAAPVVGEYETQVEEVRKLVHARRFKRGRGFPTNIKQKVLALHKKYVGSRLKSLNQFSEDVGVSTFALTSWREQVGEIRVAVAQTNLAIDNLFSPRTKPILPGQLASPSTGAQVLPTVTAFRAPPIKSVSGDHGAAGEAAPVGTPTTRERPPDDFRNQHDALSQRIETFWQQKRGSYKEEVEALAQQIQEYKELYVKYHMKAPRFPVPLVKAAVSTFNTYQHSERLSKARFSNEIGVASGTLVKWQSKLAKLECVTAEEQAPAPSAAPAMLAPSLTQVGDALPTAPAPTIRASVEQPQPIESFSDRATVQYESDDEALPTALSLDDPAEHFS